MIHDRFFTPVRIATLSGLLLVGCMGASNSAMALQTENRFELPVPEEWVELVREKSLGAFRNTYYYVQDEAKFASSPKNASLRTPKGKVLSRVNARFKKLLDIEGSGRLLDGTIVNYAGRIRGENRYLPTVHEWGRGTGNCALVPFRSVAVDRKVVPLGSVVRIEETVGMPLPDGSVHDGYWFASDTGGAIKKDRIDLFTGEKEWASALKKHGITHLEKLHLTLVARPADSSCRHQSGR